MNRNVSSAGKGGELHGRTSKKAFTQLHFQAHNLTCHEDAGMVTPHPCKGLCKFTSCA